MTRSRVVWLAVGVACIVLVAAVVARGCVRAQEDTQRRVAERYGVRDVTGGPTIVEWTDGTQRCWGRFDTNTEVLLAYGCDSIVQPTRAVRR